MQRYFFAIGVLVVFGTVCDGTAREWKDQTGKYSVEAQFVELKDGEVHIRKDDGKVIVVPLEKLCLADQRYVEQQKAERQRASRSRPHKEEELDNTGGGRLLPSFPRALQRPPAWMLPKAPFDVPQFLAVPPLEQNAAPLYLDALFEFDELLSVCYGKHASSQDEEIKRRAQLARSRQDAGFKFLQAWQDNPKSVDLKAVDIWLAQYASGFEKLAAAQQRPKCVFQTGIGPAAMTPHSFGALQVARVMVWRTRRALAKGDFEQPINDVEMLLRLSRDLRPRANDVCQIVSLKLVGLYCRQIVAMILTTRGITAQHCDRLLAALVKHQSDARDSFVETVKNGYVNDRILLHDLHNHTGLFDPRFLKEEIGWRGPVDSAADCFDSMLKLRSSLRSPEGRLACEKYGSTGKLVDRLSRLGPPIHPLVRGWSADGKLLADNDYAKEVDALSFVCKSLLGVAGQTNRKRYRALADEAIVALLRKTDLAIFMDPWLFAPVIAASLRSEAALRGTTCLIAIRRWQMEHPTSPPDLAALVQTVGLKTVPLDPYTDQPLRMIIIQGQPVIYSVGWDGKDDRASIEWSFDPSKPRGDIVFRLHYAR